MYKKRNEHNEDFVLPKITEIVTNLIQTLAIQVSFVIIEEIVRDIIYNVVFKQKRI